MDIATQGDSFNPGTKYSCILLETLLNILCALFYLVLTIPHDRAAFVFMLITEISSDHLLFMPHLGIRDRYIMEQNGFITLLS